MKHILCINPTQPHLDKSELISDLHHWSRVAVNNNTLDRLQYMVANVQVFPTTTTEAAFLDEVNNIPLERLERLRKDYNALYREMFEEARRDKHWNKFQDLLSDDDPAKAPRLLKPEDFEFCAANVPAVSATFKGFDIVVFDDTSCWIIKDGAHQSDWPTESLQDACDIVNKELSNED